MTTGRWFVSNTYKPVIIAYSSYNVTTAAVSIWNDLFIASWVVFLINLQQFLDINNFSIWLSLKVNTQVLIQTANNNVLLFYYLFICPCGPYNDKVYVTK